MHFPDDVQYGASFTLVCHLYILFLAIFLFQKESSYLPEWFSHPTFCIADSKDHCSHAFLNQAQAGALPFFLATVPMQTQILSLSIQLPLEILRMGEL